MSGPVAPSSHPSTPRRVFEVTEQELERADDYEPAGYVRIEAVPASGKRAWVHADARWTGGAG